MLDILNQATQFAAIAHDGDYRKKRPELPYISHPAMVAMLLLKLGLDEEIVAAAILHDTVEDTAVTIEDIKNKFGKTIAELVGGCTEDKTKTWQERKQHQLDAIKTAPYGVLMIKLADKLHNITAMVQDKQELGEQTMFEGFNAGAEKQKWYYQGLVKSFETRSEINSSDMFKLFKSRVKEIYG